MLLTLKKYLKNSLFLQNHSYKTVILNVVKYVSNVSNLKQKLNINFRHLQIYHNFLLI